MPRPALPAPPPNTVTARLPDGRYLIAHLDPTRTNTPLRRALTAAGIPTFRTGA